MHLKSRLLAICITAAGFCNAQELVKDINKTPASQPPYDLGYSQRCYSCGGKTYAILTDSEHGSELWVTDGTEQGTHLVKDIEPGIGTGVFGPPACLNNKLYISGLKLWKTDGTEAGTQMLFNGFGLPVLFGDKIAFMSNDMLFTTNGDPTNIKVVKTFTPPAGQHYNFNSIIATADHIYIQMILISDETGEFVSYQVWASDGDATIMIKELPASMTISFASSIQNKYLFNIYDENGLPDTWVSDGTVDGTTLLMENTVLPPYDGFNRVVNGKHILTSYGRGTWLTDGTPGGTTLIIDGFSAYDAREFNGKVYFLGNDSDEPIYYRIMRTNADYAGAVTVAAPLYGTALLGVVGEKLLYAGTTSSQGIELMAFDGNLDQPSIVKDIYPGAGGSFGRSFISVNGVGVFLADDGTHGYELWRSDGTTAGTTLLKDVATGTETARIEDVYFHDKKMYFLATDDLPSNSGASRRMYVSDGTAEGTSILDAINKDYYGIYFGGIGKYVVTDGVYGLDKTDVATGVRSQLISALDLYSGTGGAVPTVKLAVGDNLYFIYHFSPVTGPDPGMELWRVNAVTNELVLTKDINPGIDGSSYTAGIEGAVINNKLIFGAFDGQESEPWITDGTPAGTVLLKDINPAGSSYPLSFTSVAGKVFFIASFSPLGNQLWITDGTTAGTKMVKTPSGANNRATYTSVGALGTDKVLFGATTSGNTTELWISDGSADGTKPVKTINESKEIYLSRFTSVGNKVYFVEDDKRLWVTDGTDAGTTRIEFDNGGTLMPDNRAVSNGVFYFVNNGKIWYTYGSSASTQVLGTANPTSDLFVTDKYVCFVQNDAVYGVELFRFPVPDAAITGLEDVTEERTLTLYPNPTDRSLFIGVTSPSYARIMDLNGRECLSQLVTIDNNAIDVSSLSAGMYIIQIKGDKQTYHVRFLKR